jgi:centrosomal protein CEP104
VDATGTWLESDACPFPQLPPAQARELKSVYVNADAAFLKLVIHECHNNKYNDRNQVSIIAVNVLGSVLPGHALDGPGTQPPGGVVRRPTHSKPPGVHDLAVDMRLDPETAATIRQVSAMKEKAVMDEDFALVRWWTL